MIKKRERIKKRKKATQKGEEMAYWKKKVNQRKRKIEDIE